MTEKKLEAFVGQILTQDEITVAAAESCTGGLLCSRLTDIPGSSSYLAGGIVAYSYNAKEQLLGVPHETLMSIGAVNETVAIAMAKGVRKRLGADIGIGITGIAGPGGGSPEKPVGLVYIALSGRDGDICRRYVWTGDRLENKQLSVDAALSLICSYLGREYL